jgi:hypothetical protein
VNFHFILTKSLPEPRRLAKISPNTVVEDTLPKHVSDFSKRLFVLLSLTVLPPTYDASGQEHKPSTALKTDSGLPLLAIKDCLKSVRSAECLDNLFREILRDHSTSDVLHIVDRFEAEDADLRRDCHPVVHAIGRETFRLKGNIHDSFMACDQTCQSGCYHGSVERFLRGDEVYAQSSHPSQRELKQKAAAACDPNTPVRLRFQCLHGLGHALMFFSHYELNPSLAVCDALPDDWSQSSCYGGVFMENVFNSTHEKKNFLATDYHYPCNQIADKYRGECYMMQTSYMAEMGLSTERLLAECAKAGAYRTQCTQSIGRDLSNAARLSEPRAVAAQCELARDESRIACMRGVIYALIDNTWDGRYAIPFCAGFSGDSDREGCLQESIQYLRTVFEKSRDDIAKECKGYVVNSQRCMELAAR